jgi:hypothetical protein
MQPQTEQESPKTDFGFMMNQQQPPPSSGPAGKISSFGKPAKILVGLGALFAIVIVAALIFSSGSSGSSQQVLDLMAQNQEIVRVSAAQDQKFSDGNTKGLSATTQAALTSQQKELASYLSKTKVKYGQKELAAKTNPATDTQLETAAQNNSLDDAYAQYLKSSLSAYSVSLSKTYKSTDSTVLKTALQAAYDSVKTLLDSPQFRG